MVVCEGDVITNINAMTYLSCQTQAESNAGSNTSANLLYSSQSRTQGNFTIYYAAAQDQLALDIVKMDVTLSDDQKERAYAYLIQHYFEKKFKAWDAVSISQGGDSVTKRYPTTSGYQNYIDFLNGLRAVSTVTTDQELHTDHDNYPDAWKDSQMDIDEIELEDPT